MIADRDVASARGSGHGPTWVPPIVGYARAIRRHLRLCVAIVLLAVFGAAAWMATHTAEYEASTQLLVTPLAEADSSFVGLPMIRSQGSDPQRAVTTAAALAQSSEILALTSEELDGELSPADIELAVEIIANEDENIVELTATAADAEVAAALANAYAESVLAARQAELRPLIAEAIERAEAELAKLADIEGLRASELKVRLSDLRFIDDGADPTLAVAQPASVPTAPEGPPRWLVLAVALVAGLVVAATTAILIEVLAPGSIDNEDDLLRAYPLPILARVPVRSRRGGELSPEAREAFRTLRGQLELHQNDAGWVVNRAPTPGRLTGVVLITSPMTGDGKTTAALALGRITAATGADVVLLETDLRKPDVAARLGVEPDRDLTDLLGADTSLRRVATPSPDTEGLSFIAAPRIDNMAMIERLGAMVPSLLAQSGNDDLCIVVDTAALGEVSDALLILGAADHVVVVVRVHHTTHGALVSLRDSLERAGVRAAGFVVFDSPLAAERPTTGPARVLLGRGS